MRLVWELTINGIEIWIIYDFLARYFEYRVEGWMKYVGTVIFAGASFTVVSLLSYVVLFESSSTHIIAVINFIFCICLLKGNIFEKIFISVFIMAIVMLIAVTTAFSFSLIEGNDVNDIYYFLDPMRMAATATTKVVLFGFTRLMLYLRRTLKFSFKQFLLLILMPSFSLMAVAVLMPAALENRDIQRQTFTVIAIIAVMNILTYYLFIAVGKSNRLKQDYTLLQLQYESERKRAEETRVLYEEIRAVRHDLKNHLLCIQLLAEQGKNQEIHDYIHDFTEESRELDRTFLYTGNDVLDAILNTKISIAEQEGISCWADIRFTKMPLSQGDISVLMGNLIDNAYEAAIQAEEKRIEVKMYEERNYLNILVRNTTKAPVLKENPELNTTKSDDKIHGLGTKNIRKIVRKYEGMLEYTEDKNLFLCHILLPLDTKHVL